MRGEVVVVADDAHVPRHRDPGGQQHLEQADGQQVRGGHDAVHLAGPQPGQQLLRGGAALLLVDTLGRELEDRAETGVRQGMAEPAAPVVHGTEHLGAANEGEPAPPLREQMLGGDPAAVNVVHRHGAEEGRGRGEVQQHQRGVGAAAAGHGRHRLVVAERDEHPGDPELLEGRDVAELAAELVVAVGEQGLHPVLLGVAPGTPSDVDEQRVAQVGEGEADGLAAPAGQGPREPVGTVLELLHGREHPLPRRRHHPLGMVQHVRDGADGHPGTTRDVRQRRPGRRMGRGAGRGAGRGLGRRTGRGARGGAAASRRG